MAKFSCEIKKLLVLGADPSFLLKKNVYTLFKRFESNHTAQCGLNFSYDEPILMDYILTKKVCI